MLMIAHALVNRADMFRKRRGFWFIDNVASLMCLLRGRSDSVDLEKIVQFIHVALFALEASLFGNMYPVNQTGLTRSPGWAPKTRGTHPGLFPDFNPISLCSS